MARQLATEQSALAPVLVAFAGPAPQSRLTVLVRIFMVIPQLVVLWLLGIAAMVVVIIGWFGALFTGRLPVFAADFLTGYLRWLTRVLRLHGPAHRRVPAVHARRTRTTRSASR